MKGETEMEVKDRYRIIDRSGATVATAQIIDDARHAAEKYDAKHIYDCFSDEYKDTFRRTLYRALPGD